MSIGKILAMGACAAVGGAIGATVVTLADLHFVNKSRAKADSKLKTAVNNIDAITAMSKDKATIAERSDTHKRIEALNLAGSYNSYVDALAIPGYTWKATEVKAA